MARGLELPLDEREELIFDEAVYVIRNAKGGISEERVMRMSRWRRRKWADAFERLIQRENEAAKTKTDSRSDE